MKIVTAAQMKKIDLECARRGTPASALMENAGKAVAEETRRFLGALDFHRILCLVGGGNNGGDGLVAARYLTEWGADISIYLCADRPAYDANFKLVRERGIKIIEAKADKGLKKFDQLLGSATCVIDALLGTGKMRPLEGVFKAVLEKVNAAGHNRSVLVVAVDLPSGLDADTGAIDPSCPSADLTVALAFPKPGLFIFPAVEKVGKLVIADIGIPESLADSSNIELLDRDWARKMLPKRALNSNKGSFGRVLVVAGSEKYTGAAYLACSGALRVGAGLVTLAAKRSLQPAVASKLVEATYFLLPESEPAKAAELVAQESPKYDVLLLGCGLGQHPDTVKFVKSLFGKKGLSPMVIDADGLNIISGIPRWWKRIPDNVILTPHPGEMSRLSGLTIEGVQADRIAVAAKYAVEWQKTVVLKGAFTVIAAADGKCRVSPFANPGLATAGTGDVLAGAVAGLAAQGMAPYDAASLGVFLHGETGEMIKNVMGDAGMIASDLLPALPVAIKRIKNKG